MGECGVVGRMLCMTNRANPRYESCFFLNQSEKRMGK
jgi:hypothetical protein